MIGPEQEPSAKDLHVDTSWPVMAVRAHLQGHLDKLPEFCAARGLDSTAEQALRGVYETAIGELDQFPSEAPLGTLSSSLQTIHLGSLGERDRIIFADPPELQ